MNVFYTPLNPIALLSVTWTRFSQNKFYTRTRIRVSQLAKIQTLFPDFLRSLNLLFDCIERESVKTLNIIHKMPQ